jgi:ATP-binding cassette subfamily C protein LapB
VAQLNIQPGERIGILGPIGSGKSTLLRLLSGLYHTQQGSLLIDGLDITHVSREVLSRQVGYLQQDHRLFQGTLRENLLIGLPDPGDDVLQQAMERTGMARLVASHPKGLERPIMEGGKGLSGGQRQLVAFTRLALARPGVLLLDEPTASMDDEQERRCLAVLTQEANAGKTLIVVTHKPSLLPLVNRLIVVAANHIVLDGPRDVVLQKLSAGNRPPTPSPAPTSVQQEVLA